MGPIPGSGRSPGVGNGNPLQDSCLENSMSMALQIVGHTYTHTHTNDMCKEYSMCVVYVT